jgi:hypothetical protein
MELGEVDFREISSDSEDEDSGESIGGLGLFRDTFGCSSFEKDRVIDAYFESMVEKIWSSILDYKFNESTSGISFFTNLAA